MSLPLMPKATAVWLVENTALTFKQIADFCGLHSLEIQGIADGEVAMGIKGLDPTNSGQLEWAEIKRCAADPSASLQLTKSTNPPPMKRTKGPRYVPVSKRQDKPDASSLCPWLSVVRAPIAPQLTKSATYCGVIRSRNSVAVGMPILVKSSSTLRASLSP